MGSYDIFIGAIVLMAMGALLAFLPERGRRRLGATTPNIPSRPEGYGWIALAVGTTMLVVWLAKDM